MAGLAASRAGFHLVRGIGCSASGAAPCHLIEYR